MNAEIEEVVRPKPSKEVLEMARAIAAHFGDRKISTKTMFNLLLPRLMELEQKIQNDYAWEQWMRGLNGRN